jgi:hypothetical protein
VRTLTRRELNRALLARQLLLERGRLPLPEALERVGGIQAQYVPSMYVGVWSRLEGFERADLTGALERREVVQGTLMRSTIHLVSRADYWPLAIAVRAARREHWLRVYPEPTGRATAAAARRLRRELAGGSLRRAEVEALLGKDRARGIHQWLDIVRVPPSGTWERRRADLYAAAADWIGEPQVSERDAMDILVRRYLAGFGPATRKDVASFTGLSLTTLGRVLGRLELRTFRSEETGEELLDVPDGALPEPDATAPPRFLPTWDATLLVHARRTGLLREEHRPRIFNTKSPHSFPTFLVDGMVAGTWRYEDGRIRLDPFAPLDAAAGQAVEEEAERLAAFHAWEG